MISRQTTLISLSLDHPLNPQNSNFFYSAYRHKKLRTLKQNNNTLPQKKVEKQNLYYTQINTNLKTTNPNTIRLFLFPLSAFTVVTKKENKKQKQINISKSKFDLHIEQLISEVEIYDISRQSMGTEKYLTTWVMNSVIQCRRESFHYQMKGKISCVT